MPLISLIDLPSDGVVRDNGGESGHLLKMILRPRETVLVETVLVNLFLFRNLFYKDLNTSNGPASSVSIHFLWNCIELIEWR